VSLFTLGEPRTPEPRARPGEIARGDYWSIVREGDDYILCYLSGELLGREKRLVLDEREARSIMAGHVPVEQFLSG
jgi:hypothetical protein